MASSLYNLNKDILVKLVAEIQEMTKRQYQKKINHLEKQLGVYKDYADNGKYPLQLDKCTIPDCTAEYYSNSRDYDCRINCEYMVVCYTCDEWYCDKHVAKSWRKGDYKDLCVPCNEKK